jgi:hypothetical protein
VYCCAIIIEPTAVLQLSIMAAGSFEELVAGLAAVYACSVHEAAVTVEC